MRYRIILMALLALVGVVVTAAPADATTHVPRPAASAPVAHPMVGGGCIDHHDLYGILRPCASINHSYGNNIDGDVYYTPNSRPGCQYIKIDIVSEESLGNGVVRTRKETATQTDPCFSGYHIGEAVVARQGRKYYTRVWSNHLQEFRSPAVWLPSTARLAAVPQTSGPVAHPMGTGGGCINHTDLYGKARVCVSIAPPVVKFGAAVYPDAYWTRNSRPGCQYIKMDVVSKYIDSSRHIVLHKETLTSTFTCHETYLEANMVEKPQPNHLYYARLWTNHQQELDSPTVSV